MHYYTDAQYEVWHLLYKNQYELANLFACSHFINGLEILELDPKQIPQIMDVSKRLIITSGWKLQPVTGLVNHMKFFKLLSNKQFPVSTRCRSFQEIHFCSYPDIFHKIFGHAPMLTYPGIANFLEAVGKIKNYLNNKVEIKQFDINSRIKQYPKRRIEP